MKLCIPFVLIAALGSCTSPSHTRTVLLLGRFTAPQSKPDLTHSLTTQGHVVVDSMTPGVDLVVVGSDPVSEDGKRFVPIRDLPAYSAATSRGIEIVDKATAVDRFQLDSK